MGDPEGARWDEIQGLAPGDRLTVTISRKDEEGDSISDIYYGHHGKRKQNGYIKLTGIHQDIGSVVSLEVTRVGETEGEIRTVYGRKVENGGPVGSEFLVEIRRPSSKGRYDEIMSTARYHNVKRSLPTTVAIDEENKHGVPIVRREGLEIEVPDAEVGEEVTIYGVHVRQDWDREIIEASITPTEGYQEAVVELGERKRVLISRISNSGNAIAEINGEELNLGPLDCDPGAKVEVSLAEEGVAVCLHQEVWRDDYRKRFNHMIDGMLPETIPDPKSDFTSPSEIEEPDQEEDGRNREEVDVEELRDRAEEAAQENPPTVTRSTKVTQEYSRSEEVKQYVKARAGGVCEGCGEPAPFVNTRGEPYLHAHHVYELSEGGSDTPETVIALCPNCHYRVHHSKDGDEYNQALIEKLAEIESVPVEEIREQ